MGARPALTAIEAIDASGNLVLAGLDCSLGHQLSRFHVFEACLREAMAFCAVVRARCGVEVSALTGCATYLPCAGKHEVQLIGRASPAGSRPASVAGSLGGSRTAPVSATRLPADLTVGDLLAVAGTGAYHHVDDAGLGGLPVLGVADGQVRTLRRRDTFDDMLRSVA